MNSDIVEEVKSSLDIVDIISEYISVKKMGNNYKAVCPFHSEKTPSFVISEEKQIYKCFGCNEGGDLINFVMKMENLEFLDALEILAKKAGIEFNKDNIKDKESLVKKERFLNMNLLAARYFFDCLWKTQNEGRSYFGQRGLDEKIIKRFGLGFAPRNWTGLLEFLETKGFTQEDIVECGLATKGREGKNRDKFINRVIFPIFDIRGNVIGFGGRVLDTKYSPKYLNSPESFAFSKRKNLYSLNFAKKHLKDKDHIILVEGYMDVISLNQFGIENVVATLGTALTKEQAKILKKYTGKIVIAYDSDQAGIDAAKRAFSILKGEGLERRILNLKDCKDPDEFVRKYGVKELESQVQNAVSDIEFSIAEIKRDSNLKSTEGIFDFIKKIAGVLKGEGPVKSEYYIKQIAKETGISADSIFKEIYGESYQKAQPSQAENFKFQSKSNQKFKNKNFKQDDKKRFESNIAIKRDKSKESELSLVGKVLENERNVSYVLEKLGVADFSYPEVFESIQMILEGIGQGDLEGMKKSVAEKLNMDLSGLEDIIKRASEFELDVIIKGIKLISIEKEINELLEEQKKLQESSSYKNKSSEVDIKLLDIGIKIMEKREFLRKNK